MPGREVSGATSLTRSGFRTTLLEYGTGVGWKWRNAYDRLRINTSTLTSCLPGMRFPRGTGLWPTRDALVRSGTAVTRIAPRSWRVATSSGDIRTRVTVLATGRDATPLIPERPGCELFRGPLIHASSTATLTLRREARVGGRTRQLRFRHCRRPC